MSLPRSILALLVLPFVVFTSPGALGSGLFGTEGVHACCSINQSCGSAETLPSCCQMETSESEDEITCKGGCGSCVCPAIAISLPDVPRHIGYQPGKETFVAMETLLKTREESPEAPPPKIGA